MRSLCFVLGLLAASSLGASGHAGTTSYYYDAQGRVTGLTSSTADDITSYATDSADNRTSLQHSLIGPPSAVNLINAGQGLMRGQSIYSPDQSYQLNLGNDGNLVLYGPSGVVWSSGTTGNPAAFLIMQSDGNLVLYDAQWHLYWASATSGHSGAYLALQTGGNLVIYESNGTTALWNTGT